MRVLLCPDKFKGSFTAAEVCAHLERGLREGAPSIEIDAAPMADGGEGTLEAALGSAPGRLVSCAAQGPLGEWIEAAWAVTDDGVAILESARFCGLALVPPGRRDPRAATSLGLGQGIAAALEAGLRRLVIGLGGSATIDGGAGMARALGFRLLDGAGRPWSGGAGGLEQVERIDPLGAHPDLEAARFLALCDVPNRLLGPEGAAAVFGPQKGAAPDQIPRLERGLERLAGAIGRWRGFPPAALADREGAGAAGGLGMGAAGFLGAELTDGATWLMERAGLPARIARADLVVTGEGSLDRQSAGGKVVAAVLRAAAAAGRPAVVVAGRWDGSLPEVYPEGLEVLSGAACGGPERGVGAADLAEMGRRIAASHIDRSH